MIIEKGDLRYEKLWVLVVVLVGGAVRFRPCIVRPCTVYLLNGEGDLVLGRERGSFEPIDPPRTLMQIELVGINKLLY